MNRLAFFLLLVFSPGWIIAQSAKMETQHFKVNYETEAEKFVVASLKVLESAWNTGSRNGYSLPERITFRVLKTDRNVLYFDRKSLKGITLEYQTMNSFLSPKQGGKNTIYGLCHELGHLCMYNATTNKNNWMSYNFREAWADFWGNFVIDSVHAELGKDFWPEPYDYLNFSGMEYMTRRIEQNNPKIAEFNQAGKFWMDLNSLIGFENMNQLLEQVNVINVSNPDAEEEFLRALKTVANDDRVGDLFTEFANILILDW
jgi:hypothetical protein